MCPVSMTDSLTRTLRRFGDPALVARYLPALTSQDMDALHQGAMFMTEQGAGSDVGATTVVDGQRAARRQLGADRRQVVLLQPRCRAGDGAGAARRARHPAWRGCRCSCCPARCPAARPNRFRIVRLKDPSSAPGPWPAGRFGWRAPPPGWSATRAPGSSRWPTWSTTPACRTAVRAAGLMRRAVAEARFVADRRVAFGSTAGGHAADAAAAG